MGYLHKNRAQNFISVATDDVKLRGYRDSSAVLSIRLSFMSSFLVEEEVPDKISSVQVLEVDNLCNL